MAPFQARPAAGRVFSTARRVRSTEVTPAGRLRLDALARYLQEAAEDDLTHRHMRVVLLAGVGGAARTHTR